MMAMRRSDSEDVVGQPARQIFKQLLHCLSAGTFLIGGRLRQFADVLKKAWWVCLWLSTICASGNELFRFVLRLKVVIGVIQQRFAAIRSAVGHRALRQHAAPAH